MQLFRRYSCLLQVDDFLGIRLVLHTLCQRLLGGLLGDAALGQQGLGAVIVPARLVGLGRGRRRRGGYARRRAPVGDSLGAAVRA